jgi:hypothetical protein
MKKFLMIGAVLASAPLLASDCEYEKDIELTLDLTGSDRLVVLAAAGELEITGVGDQAAAEITGRACVSEEEWLEDARIEASGGKNAEISVQLPSDYGGWSLFGNRYAYIDLYLRVPASLPLQVSDSSGAIEIDGVGALELKDSSGSIVIENSSGPVVIEDSSGDIYLADIGGEVTIVSDSSGDIEGRDIDGDLRVVKDSSGDIDFSGIGGDFIVERDSSGDISADSVRGDFRVLRDGSGAVRPKNIQGEIDVPGG